MDINKSVCYVYVNVCVHVNVYVYVYLVEYVRECAHMFMTFHNGFMFLLHLFCFFTYIYKHVIMNRHGSHNIRIGIVWVQTGRSTCTWRATWCVIEL